MRQLVQEMNSKQKKDSKVEEMNMEQVCEQKMFGLMNDKNEELTCLDFMITRIKHIVKKLSQSKI